MSDELPGAAPSLTGFSVGSRVAGYRLEEEIGRGGMAVVFRARDERLGRPVALKLLAPGLAADEGFRQRFVRESRSAAAVDDPHIIPVFEAGDAGGVLFIAMRYVPGGDAGSLVRRAGPLPAARAAGIISAVASALDAAHGAGLVHRDVKPANMLMDTRPGRPDHVYLSDFGLTKGVASTASLTGTGHFLGTLDYCAPEQIQGRPVDGRTDEYALACSAYMLLSGRPPFPKDDVMAVMYAQLSAPPPPLTAQRPGLPPAVDDVLRRAMAKAPEDRYQSCGEFADALRAALGLARYDGDADVGLGAPEAQPAAGPAPATADTWQPAPGQPPPARRRRSRRAGLLVLAVAVVAAGGAAAAVFASGPGHGPARPGPARSGTPAPARSAQSTSPAGRAPSSPVVAGPSIIRTFPEPGSAQVYSVALSADGKTVATGDADGTAYLWAAGTGRQTAALREGARVLAVAFSPDGALVATGDGSGRTRLWQAGTGQLAGTVTDPGGAAVNSVAFSPDGKMLATGDKNGHAYLWAVSAGGRTTTLAGTLADPAAAGVWAVAFSPDGTRLAAGDYVGRTYLWDIATTPASPAGQFVVPGGQYVTAVAFSRDGRTLATGNLNGTVYLWTVATGSYRVISEPGTVWAVAFGRDGTVAVGDHDGNTYLHDMATGRRTAILTDPASGGQGVGAVAFSGDGKTLATGDSSGTTYLWRIAP